MQQTESDRPQITPASNAAVASASDVDPLSQLHKMSTTAGLGSGDYVEVNGAAVFALLLGLGSALTLLADILLVIPLAGIVISVLALRQIHHSNGTQTGKGLVIVGLILMLGFGGFVLFENVTAGVRTRQDRQAITEMHAQMAEQIRTGQYDKAYDFFSERFKATIKPQDFADRIKILNDSPVFGKLKAARTGLMQFQTDEATGAKFAIARLQLDFDKSTQPFADDLTLRKEAGGWRIESFPSLFGQERGGQGGQNPPPQ